MNGNTERLSEEQSDSQSQVDYIVRLNERRRAALAEIDSADFSYVLPLLELLFLFICHTLWVLQPVPYKDFLGHRHRFLHGCVSPSNYLNDVSSLTCFSSYDVFAIIIVTTMLGYVYGTETDRYNLRMFTSLLFLTLLTHSCEGALTTWQSAALKLATPVGNLIGQVLFGWLADILGRKRMCE